ncbi:MAG: GTPase Era [Pseudomonadota bacterium]|jgi:GTP-binding protein Era
MSNEGKQGGFRAGYLAIVGRPNAGKSTLLNALVGEKISIVSRKPQTTRHRITGVLTTDDTQYIFVDTPGFQTRHKNVLNRLMNRNVTQALQDVDVVLFVVEAERYGEADRQVLDLLPAARPVILVINKTDALKDKKSLLPFIARMSAQRDFAEIVPLSASKGKGTAELLRAAAKYLPEGPPLFEPDQITDRSERFIAAEFIREKLFRRLGDELPYSLTVEIERFETEGGLRRIHAVVVVDKESHKGIVIGKGGEQLKVIGTEARRDMERLFGGKVFLEIWVKVRGGWADDEGALKSLGYE